MNIEEQKQKICKYCNTIFNCRSAIEEHHMKELFGSALTLNEVHILEEIDLHMYSSMSELADALFITAGTLSTAIKKLIRKGHLLRHQDSTDKRVFTLELTKQGIAAVELHRKLHDQLVLGLWRDENINNDNLVEILQHLETFFIQAAKDSLKK